MRDTIIIVEGPQGAGKTTFTNYLREKMSSTDLYRLAGIKDKGESGFEKSRQRYYNLLHYIENSKNINMIFDRTFFSEEIYSRLGYKPYSFSEIYIDLLKKLDNLKCEIYLVVLYLEDTNEYEKRIKREKHQYQRFDVESSVKQQEEYLKLAYEVEKTSKNIKVVRFNNNENTEFDKNMEEQFGYLFK
jgi:thymidylate kinase